MNAPLRQPMTREAFLAWERRQDMRYEFDGFAPVAMTGGTFAHAVIHRNLITALTNKLRGKPCQPLGSDMKIAVAGSIRYPDALVVCAPVSPTAQVIENPAVVFEILSASTALIDRVVKNREYRDTPSIRRYVMLEQGQVAATMFERTAEGDWIGHVLTDWIGHVLTDDASLDMPEIGIALSLRELYEALDLPARPDTDEA